MKTNVALARVRATAAILAGVFVAAGAWCATAGAAVPRQQSNGSSAAARGASKTAPPANPLAQEETRARILMATKRYTEAAQAYAKLSTEDHRNSAYPNFQGIALMQVNDLEGARKCFERATKINKKFADGFNNIGAIYYAEKKYSKAIVQYRKALQIEPRTAGFYSNVGYAYFGERRFPEAQKAFQTALSIDPGTFQQNDRNGSLLQYRSVADRGLFDFMLAKGFAQKGDAKNCAAYLRRALDDGYKQVLTVRTDPAFAKVVADADVQAILELAAPAPAAAPGQAANPPAA